jgi:hypothetical protein
VVVRPHRRPWRNADDAASPSKGIFDSANIEARERVVELLAKAYWMEMETVMSYIAASASTRSKGLPRAGDDRGTPGAGRVCALLCF